MNWEKSKSLSPLKMDFIRSFFKEGWPFFLTGGSALSIFYLDHRLSYDLDFFTLKEIEWHPFENELKAIAEDIKAELITVTTSNLFRRYQLIRGDETEILDFIIEKVPQIQENKNHFGNIMVDTMEEIGVNKICTLISRSDIKDIVDLYFLSQHGFDIINHIEQAKRKDAGLDASTISYIVDELEVNELPDYMIKKVNVKDFQAFVNNLKNQLAEYSFPDDSDNK